MSYRDFDKKEQTIFKNWLKDLLKNEIVTVEFTKSDGSLRTMQATLKENMLPESDLIESTTKKINQDVCIVWDIEQSKWRSFRYDRLISVTFTLE